MDKKNSVLIVDDDTRNIYTLLNILEPKYTVYVENNGQRCLDTARALRPDLILLEIVMEKINGYDAMAMLKKNALTQDIPVIFVTGLTTAADEEKGLELGAVDYISKPFSPAVVKLRVENQMKIINQLRTIHEISITDALTGIGNRHFFYTQLEQEWQGAKRPEKPPHFIKPDIDNFKDYNDAHGHLQGDAALREVAQTLQKCVVRATDKIARWGGEEFAVILPDTDKAGALYVAEKIRETIEQHKLNAENGAHVTISLGVNSVIPSRDGTYTLENFVSDADKLLYQAKATGKNKVCAAE